MKKRKAPLILVIILILVTVYVAAILKQQSEGGNGQSETGSPVTEATEKTTGTEKTEPSTTEKPQTTETESNKETTQKPSEKATEKTTEKPTEKTTEKPTVKPTEKVTKKPSEKATEDEKAINVSHKIEGAIPKSGKVSGSYFDDTVFVGDSISLKLSYYEASSDRLGKAKFLVAGSLGATSALWDVSSETPHPRYKGQKRPIEDSVKEMGVKKVYIMLGMNDVGFVGIDKGISNYTTLIKRILKKSPNVKIYVQSMTPMAKNSNKRSEKGLNNKNIAEYNKRLAKMCSANGWYFVNVAEVMYDSKGYLKDEYCSDLGGMGMHFTNKGCKVWTDYLLTHTA